MRFPFPVTGGGPPAALSVITWQSLARANWSQQKHPRQSSQWVFLFFQIWNLKSRDSEHRNHCSRQVNNGGLETATSGCCSCKFPERSMDPSFPCLGLCNSSFYLRKPPLSLLKKREVFCFVFSWLKPVRIDLLAVKRTLINSLTSRIFLNLFPNW